MRGCLRGQQRSVDRGTHRPAIEPRKYLLPGCRRRSADGRQNGWTCHRECPDGPAWSQTLACADALCTGTGRRHVRPEHVPTRSASGRRGAVGDDERRWGVRLRHSSWETNEQGGAIRCGAGGAKGGGQGECEPQSTGRTQSRVSVSHALERIRQTVTKKRFAVIHPRWEPYARIGPVRICAGGAQ
jgi:hypothetical protein